MPTVPGTPAAPGSPTQIRHRKSVELLSDKQLADLRDAVKQILPLRDKRGYQWHAAVHGLPEPGMCEHGNLLFLPWHRAYLYFYELALRDRNFDAALPWWDWRTPTGEVSELPEAFARARVDRKANPLNSAAIDPPGRQGNWPRRTQRDPGANVASLPTPQLTESVLSEQGFREFSTRLEFELHNRIHMWVGGAMTDPRFASFDPIFWSHHCMVDRLWRIWQLRNPGATFDPRFLRRQLMPWGITVGEVIDVNQLGYEYAGTTSSAPGR